MVFGLPNITKKSIGGLAENCSIMTSLMSLVGRMEELISRDETVKTIPDNPIIVLMFCFN